MTIICIMVSCITHAGNNGKSILKISGNIMVKYEYSTFGNVRCFAVNFQCRRLKGFA